MKTLRAIQAILYAIAFIALLSIANHITTDCQTDTECSDMHGGDGGPEQRRV